MLEIEHVSESLYNTIFSHLISGDIEVFEDGEEGDDFGFGNNPIGVKEITFKGELPQPFSMFKCLVNSFCKPWRAIPEQKMNAYLEAEAGNFNAYYDLIDAHMREPYPCMSNKEGVLKYMTASGGCEIVLDANNKVVSFKKRDPRQGDGSYSYFSVHFFLVEFFKQMLIATT